MLYKQTGVMIILQLYQRNGKLPLPRQKQGNYPVITIYGGLEEENLRPLI